MRIGNLTQTVWKRSVKKQLHKRREAFLTEPLNGERCSAMKVDAQTSVVVAANASANGNTAKTATGSRSGGDPAAVFSAEIDDGGTIPGSDRRSGSIL